MKKSKLILTLALVLALTLVFTACGSEDNVRGEIAANQSPTENVTGNITPQPEVTEAPTEAPTEPENDLSLGRMEGGVYTNTYVGYGCQLNSNWTFSSAADMEQTLDNTKALLSGSELAEAMGDIQQFNDMMADNATDLTHMNVLYQKLTMQQRALYLMMSEEEIIDATLDLKDDLIAAFEQAGMLVSSMEKQHVTFMGEERAAIHTEAVILMPTEYGTQELPYFTLQIFDYHLGEYSVTTTLASYVEDNTESLLSLFFPVE